MIFVDDLKWAIDVMLHPGAKANKTWSVGSALAAYWKVAIIPMILDIIVVYALGASALSGALSSYGMFGGLAGSAVGGLLVVGVIISYIIAVPIALLIFALFVHIVGKLVGAFKGGYSTTFSGVVYGVLPYLVLSWIPFVSLIGALWDIVVTILALKNTQRTTTGMAFVAWLGGVIIVGVILFIIAAVIGLAALGLYSGVPASHI